MFRTLDGWLGEIKHKRRGMFMSVHEYCHLNYDNFQVGNFICQTGRKDALEHHTPYSVHIFLFLVECEKGVGENFGVLLTFLQNREVRSCVWADELNKAPTNECIRVWVFMVEQNEKEQEQLSPQRWGKGWVREIFKFMVVWKLLGRLLACVPWKEASILVTADECLWTIVSVQDRNKRLQQM